MKNFSVQVALCVLFLTAVSSAQDARERAAEASGSYSFRKPPAWTESSNADGFAYVNAGKTIILAVKRHNYADFKAFFADSNLERDGLELLGQPQDIVNGRYFRTVRRGQQTAVIDTFVMFSPHGGGVAIVGITNEPNADASFKSALALSQSVEFAKPKTSAVAEKVRSALSGKQLTYLYTGNGYSERMDIILCSSGEAYRSTDMGGFSPNDADGGSFGALSKKAGTWQISADSTVLTLTMNNGSFGYRLTPRQASNEIALNGKRYFVQSQSICL